MGIYNNLGNLAWVANKANEVKGAYDIYNATKSNGTIGDRPRLIYINS